MGYASAMSVILFVIIMAITVLMYRKMNAEG
jgi:multiple sugar transport system permease protein